MEKLRPLEQPLFYLAIGGLAVVVDAGLFFVLHRVFGWPVELALPAGFGCGLLTSFVLNKIWVFKTAAPRHSTTKQAVLYGGLVIGNLLFQYMFIVAAMAAGFDATMAKITATLITAVWNFFAYRLVIFTQS